MKKFSCSSSIDPAGDVLLLFPKGDVDHQKISEHSASRHIDFDGSFGEFLLLQGHQGQRVYLLGLGEEKNKPNLRHALRLFSDKTQKHWESLQIDLHGHDAFTVMQATIGLSLADYEIGAYKSDDTSESSLNVILVTDQESSMNEGIATAETINRVKMLVDAPANIKTPAMLSEWAQASAKAHGYECDVMGMDQLEKEGFGAIVAVGKGSQHPPVMIVMRHSPKPGNADVALVGKGITFDTGGISIKSSKNLHYMKSDMGGAAAVLGTMELAAKLNLPINMVGVVAAAENAVGSRSFLPGDVITSYSGKTIEVIDTDAEGRLVLADALNYVATQYQPAQMIDLATLTGSVVATLGYSAAGVFTHNEALRDDLIHSGSTVHEPLWHLPMFDDLDDDLHSDIADLRNFSNRPVAGASSAAKFLEAFTSGHKAWAHLDVAGVAFGDSPFAKMKCASGFGVQLLIEYLKSRSHG